MQPLSKEALDGLRSYKYVAGGYTKLDDWHQPFWNACVQRLPLWLAPNLITLAATMCIASAYILNIIYVPDFS
ncbi:CDP-ethanolamine:DAG ethanolamine phosphotransferase, partial [Haematococcus lacustris]